MSSFSRTDTSVLGRWWWTVDRWALVALIGILLGVGEHTPIWRICHAFAPGFDRFRSPAVAMGWTTLAGVLLAAMGLERLLAISAAVCGEISPALFLPSVSSIIILLFASESLNLFSEVERA